MYEDKTTAFIRWNLAYDTERFEEHNRWCDAVLEAARFAPNEAAGKVLDECAKEHAKMANYYIGRCEKLAAELGKRELDGTA